MAKKMRRPRGRATFLGKAERERIAAMANGGSAQSLAPSERLVEKALARDGVAPKDFVGTSPDTEDFRGKFDDDIITRS
jgi:hypothetical protein